MGGGRGADRQPGLSQTSARLLGRAGRPVGSREAGQPGSCSPCGGVREAPPSLARAGAKRAALGHSTRRDFSLRVGEQGAAHQEAVTKAMAHFWFWLCFPGCPTSDRQHWFCVKAGLESHPVKRPRCRKMERVRRVGPIPQPVRSALAVTQVFCHLKVPQVTLVTVFSKAGHAHAG